MTSPNPPTINPGERASIGRVIKDQRKAIIVALGLAAAGLLTVGDDFPPSTGAPEGA